MKKCILILSIVVALINQIFAEDIPVIKSKIESIGLFKNGLAYVKRTIQVDKTGQYMIDDVPEPVYGTYWVESDAKVNTKVTRRYVTEKINESASVLDYFGGKKVTIHYDKKEIKGTVLKPELDKTTFNWDNNYNRNYYWYYNQNNNNRSSVTTPSVKFLKVKTEKGVTFLPVNSVTYIDCEDYNKTRQMLKPVLVFDVKEMPGKTATIQLNYLTKGISWAASYLINLSDEKKLSIEQKAVIKNEFSNFNDTDIYLISGFPNVKFANVSSPLSLKTNWSSFFQQLNQPRRRLHDVMLNVMTQQAVSFNSVQPNQTTAIDMNPKGEGVDIYYNNIGKTSMLEGDSIAISVEQQQADYEKIILWDIPDTRNVYGCNIQDYERRNNPEKYQSATWDSVRFKNPFKFPMTTAAATFVKKQQFLGESISYWVNPGAETLINTNKALSIRTNSSEKEIKNTRKSPDTYIYGHRYHQVEVEGTLSLKNYRKNTAKILIKRRFSGKLLSADDDPKSEILEDGVYTVNERYELIWELNLEPGKEKIIKYKYRVLVRH